MEEALIWPFLIEDEKPWKPLAWKIRYLVNAFSLQKIIPVVFQQLHGLDFSKFKAALNATKIAAWELFYRGFQTSKFKTGWTFHTEAPEWGGGRALCRAGGICTRWKPDYHFWHWAINKWLIFAFYLCVTWDGIWSERRQATFILLTT